ncbi:apolipoprotein N-acyltransferase [Limnobacter sp.]|uniref:apolipoprotein N-acyltransferase n=1 Tax=Limnobacter sp. TaxID=2003368 RepID=UPI003512CA7B
MRSFVLAAFLGAPWALAFAPRSLWWLGLLICSALGLWVQRLASRGRPWQHAFIVGWGAGFGAFLAGVSWLYISLHTYGGLPSWLAVLSVALFALYLGLFAALACVVFHRVVLPLNSARTVLFNALAWAGLWTFFEWFRGTLFSGFAWLSLGDAMVDSPASALLAWLGNHGVLFVLLLPAYALAQTFSLGLFSHSSQKSANFKRERWLMQGSVALCVVFWGLALAGLARWPVQTVALPPIPVAGVQTNVDQSIKFDPDLIVGNMQKAFALGDQAKATLAEGGLLLFPETVNPLVWTDTPEEWRERFRDFARPGHTSVVMGSAVQEGRHYHNAIVLFDGSESGADLDVPKKRHDKRHLVPFGEFIPFGFSWFVAMLNMPMGEFTPGLGPLQPLEVLGNRLASTVCYEDTFSGEFASLLDGASQEPTVLVNLSNLAWFGQSWALDQHAQMGRTRSAEHHKPGLRATNTGISGLIDHRGQWLVQAPPGQALVWGAQLQGRVGKTPFARWGSSVWFIIWGAVLLLLCVREARRRAYNRAH